MVECSLREVLGRICEEGVARGERDTRLWNLRASLVPNSPSNFPEARQPTRSSQTSKKGGVVPHDTFFGG